MFNKGDHLGLTGNSGNSEGPHLHFEIRDRSSAIPLNVLEYGFDIMDNVKPVIQTLAVYPLIRTAVLNGAYEKVLVKPALKNGHYVLPENTVGIQPAILDLALKRMITLKFAQSMQPFINSRVSG